MAQETREERQARLDREARELAHDAPELSDRQLARLRMLLRPRVPRPSRRGTHRAS